VPTKQENEKIQEEDLGRNPVIGLSTGPGRNVLDIPKIWGFEVKCPYCHSKLRFKKWGCRVRCGKCGKAFLLNERGSLTPREGDKRANSIKRGKHDLKHRTEGLEIDAD